MVMREEWGKVFQGAGEPCTVAARFLSEYGAVVPDCPEVELPALEWKKLKAAFRNAPRTAGGCDGWLPAELAVIPDAAVRWVACMLRRVEDGASWPRDLTIVR
eukprot:1190746-Alexandrium_andersonii.AAC.1